MIEIEGADQLATLAKRLKEAGDRELQRELSKAVNSAVKPLKQAIAASAEETLPRKGGLADEAAAAKLLTRRRVSTAESSVRIVARSRLSLWHLNQGIVRHRRKGVPASGWTVQQVKPGFWDKPTGEMADEVRRELVAAMTEIASRVGQSL